jgi:hypothetical protein
VSQSKPRADTARNDPAVDDVAARLRATNFWRCGWSDLNEVQKADAIEAFMAEAERFAMSNIEGRPISRDEYEDVAGARFSAADWPDEAGR